MSEMEVVVVVVVVVAAAAAAAVVVMVVLVVSCHKAVCCLLKTCRVLSHRCCLKLVECHYILLSHSYGPVAYMSLFVRACMFVWVQLLTCHYSCVRVCLGPAPPPP
jgi:hypothetical protein